LRAAYGAATLERLMLLKMKYDPTNRFNMNQNVAPPASV
jgi:FAD/FMN-containing dehydrogenase